MTTSTKNLVGIKIIPTKTKPKVNTITLSWRLKAKLLSEMSCRYNRPINIATRAKSTPSFAGFVIKLPSKAPAIVAKNQVK